MPTTYDRKDFFDHVRASVFDGWLASKQVAGISAILDGWEKLFPDGDPRCLAYCLATADWETAHTMQPIEEIGHGRGRAYGSPAGPYRQIYYGRGLVQLTWKEVYAKAEKALRVLRLLKPTESLVRDPSLALRPDLAAAIMFYGMTEGWFTGRKLASYFNAKTDWVNARRIINGTDHAAEIAAIAKHFFAALKASMVFDKTVAPAAPTP